MRFLSKIKHVNVIKSGLVFSFLFDDRMLHKFDFYTIYTDCHPPLLITEAATAVRSLSLSLLYSTISTIYSIFSVCLFYFVCFCLFVRLFVCLFVSLFVSLFNETPNSVITVQVVGVNFL